ncbi:MAG: Lrp/AsnC family transcriptional regulator [Nanoarchaeota archaeon]|nr:Lrp/AsnC family transcriptional regulator [Nanoarchaeota archaeon]MBU1622282.1 Lrp/AsnC family transcriptional regulator [Nanoarchaeota archaeon]
MRTLNQSERKVLTLLEENCRLSANQIAKKTRLSAEGVLKIIKRLEEAKVITRFNTKINYSRVGYKIYPVHIKLLRLNSKIMNEIKEVISNHKTCAWYTFCEGEYDLLLSFKILSEKDKIDMNKLLLEISDNILEKEISIVLHAFEISKSFLNQTHTNKLFPIFNHDLEKAELSDDEMKILNILKSNSRENILNISKKMNLSARVVSSKIKKLEKLKVISGFKTKINTATLSFQPCIALISLGKYHDQELRKFMTYCQQKRGINYLVRQIGKYDIELTIDVYNVNDFYKLMDDIREQFSFIKKITTLISKESS